MNLKNICLICAAVVVAWTSLLIWMWSGHSVDKILLALLMGMTAGAIATKYGHNLFGKSWTVIFSIPAIWFIVKDRLIFGIIFAALAILPSLFINFKLNTKKGAQQSDRFEDCC